MDTGEVFGWIFFFIFVSILFFAAFGSASVTEDTVIPDVVKFKADLLVNSTF